MPPHVRKTDGRKSLRYWEQQHANRPINASQEITFTYSNGWNKNFTSEESIQVSKERFENSDYPTPGQVTTS
jgi:hypothetical protein